jgi:methylamine---glutamate N-methyltransferase subunit B
MVSFRCVRASNLTGPVLVSLRTLKAIDLHRTIQSHLNSDGANSSSSKSEAEDAKFAIRIEDAAGQDFVGSGLRFLSNMEVIGDVGDFALMSFGEGECKIEGNAGHFFCHSLHSGLVILRGHAGDSLCALGASGFVAVYGNVGHRVAVGMQGSELVIRGSVGDYACLGMRSGSVVIGGNAGKDFGQGMVAGTIFLRGDAESISQDVEENRMREPDRLKIGLLMIKAGIKSTGKEFRMFRSIHSE